MLPSAASPSGKVTQWWLISRNHSPRASTAPEVQCQSGLGAGGRKKADARPPQATILHTGAPSKFILSLSLRRRRATTRSAVVAPRLGTCCFCSSRQDPAHSLGGAPRPGMPGRGAWLQAYRARVACWRVCLAHAARAARRTMRLACFTLVPYTASCARGQPLADLAVVFEASVGRAFDVEAAPSTITRRR